jgi:hypothetical protein
MSPAVWLRPNRRALLIAALPMVLAVVAGAWLGQAFGAAGIPTAVGGVVWIWLGRVVAVLAAIALAFLIWQAFRPRLACLDGNLLVYLRPGPPIRVPLDVVECFLLGQGATLDNRLPSRTVVLTIRLAEKRTEWAHVEVHRLLGAWCGGQITIRGTWSEPLSLAVVNQLNERLAAAQQELAQRETAGARGSA